MYRLILLLVLLLPTPSLAESGKKKCPKLIGDLTTGEVVYSKGRYECFSSENGAFASGFRPGAGVPAPTSSGLTFTGKGQQDTAPFAIKKKPFYVHITTNGRKDYCGVVLRKASNGDWVELLVNEIGFVDTRRTIHEKGNFYLEVDCGPSWTIEIS